MDHFKLAILLQSLSKNMNVISRLDNIKNLTKLSDYIKMHKIKNMDILNIYINASQHLLGVKNG